MTNMKGCLRNATPTTSWHQLHWWKSPRWIVIRIEVLAVVAIIFSFFLAAFGSCRRWSNSWIVQKGFFVAQVLSLSLGTYSIGLMQSSSVKSEMYPIWTVSLFTLFGCIDPVTTYNGLDYKGPLSKVVYGICLNCGYVLLMSISTISNVVGNAAIITLSAITFVKGFHRSFALVQQNRMRGMVYTPNESIGETCIIRKDSRPLGNYDKRRLITIDLETGICHFDIEVSIRNNRDKLLKSCYDVCVALSLSHNLQRYFLGLDCRVPRPETLMGIDYEWALKVTEIELAFVYDAFFTGNPFFHYYQAKAASLWALASFTGICFVLVTTAIPGGMTRRSGASGCTKVVGTTTADLAITFGILVSLALLQLTQLVRSWTSNWAKAAVACAYARKEKEIHPYSLERGFLGLRGWMKLKVFVATSTNLFDRYLWQDKISQYSMLPEPRLLTGGKRKGEWISSSKTKGGQMRGRCGHLVQTLGLHYIWLVIWELLSSDSNKRGSATVDEDVKGSVIDFLSQIQSGRLDGNWLSSLPEEPQIRYFLPHFNDPLLLTKSQVHCYRYISCVMTWHIVTWYCELAEQKKRQEDAMMSKVEGPIGYGRETAASYCFQRRGGGGGGEGGGTNTRDHRHVAKALSMYCVYLVKSAPELLPGPVAWTKRVYDCFVLEAKETIILGNMSDDIVFTNWYANMDIIGDDFPDYLIQNGQALAKLLLMRRPDEIWKTLALVWVQLLVYAAPYGNAEAHMRCLSQGGEFITHLWALLYHLNIREWEVLEANNLHNISTIEDAQRVLSEDDHDLDIVVFFASPARLQEYQDEFVTASRLINGVKFYLTSSPDVAKCLNFPAASIFQSMDILFLNNTDKKFAFFSTCNSRVYRHRVAQDFALFVYETKLASAKARAQEAAPSTIHSAIPIEKQSSEDGQTVVEIEEEIQPSPSSS